MRIDQAEDVAKRKVKNIHIDGITSDEWKIDKGCI